MKLILEVIENHHMPFNIAGTSRSTGKPFSFFKQNVYAHIGGAFPFKFETPIKF